MSVCKMCGQYYYIRKSEFYCFRDYEELVGCVKFGARSLHAKDEEEAAIKYCNNNFETPASLEVLVIGKYFFVRDGIENASQSEIDEICKKIYEKCRKFYIESELIRDFFIKREIK